MSQIFVNSNSPQRTSVGTAPATPHDAAAFAAQLAQASPRDIIETAMLALPDRLAVVSSFGTESAVLLKFVADVDRSLPVLFLDTLWLFKETLAYRDALIARLGLTDVRTVTPSPSALALRDPQARIVLPRPRRLLRHPQGRAAGQRACGIRRLDVRTQALSRRRARGAPRGRGRRAAAEIQSAGTADARRTQCRRSPRPNCRATRWKLWASARSAACRAPTARAPAARSAAAAGAASPRPNAASTQGRFPRRPTHNQRLRH